MSGAGKVPAASAARGHEAVVVLAKGFPPVAGGVEEYSAQVARAYMRAGCAVTVLTQTEGDPGWAERRFQDGVCRLWNAGPGGQAMTSLRLARAVLTLRRDTSVALVHSTTWRVGVVGRFMFPGARRVVTVHGREVLNVPRFARPLMRAVLANAQLVLAVSHATESIARRAMGGRRRRGRWTVSHNGLSFPVEPSEACNEDGAEARGTVHVLSLCRLVPRKNVESSLRALAALRDRGIDDFRFRIAGHGPEGDRLREVAHVLGLDDRVEFLGYVEDASIPHLYEWADVFLHPHTHVGDGADFEGFGLVIADAMSFECAVIAGTAGGPAELIDDGEDGFLVDGSHLDEIVARLGSLIEDPALRSRLGTKARAAAREKFSWDKHVAPVLALFQHSTATGGAPLQRIALRLGRAAS